MTPAELASAASVAVHEVADAKPIAAELQLAGGRLTHRGRSVRLPSPAIDAASLRPVTSAIYDRYYRNAGAGRGSYRSIEDRNLKRVFSARLAAASATDESWSEGWEVLNDLDGRLVLRREKGRVRGVEVAHFRIAPGARTGAVRVPSTSDTMQPGWFFARGATAHEAAPGETVRLYFALCRAGAVALVHSATSAFNDAGVPFTLKVDSDPDGYRRADAGVLYAARRDWERMRGPLREVHAAVGPYLRDRTPLFTLRLAPGVGLAEEPAEGGSFGMHRAGLCAQGLLAAGAAAPPERLAAIAAAFQAAGVDPARPWLASADGPGPSPDYRLDLPRQDLLEEALRALA